MHPALADVPNLTGTLDTDDQTLERASRDYGGTVHKRPIAVLQPRNPADISALIKHARTHGLAVIPRGAGHSTSGQAQAPEGFVLDMTSLATIHDISPTQVVVDAGARWSDVLRATLPHGLSPPVLTDYLELTVGGTLSVGGLGGASHHHGAQTDNVLSLEVVTPTGESITCTSTSNREVFDAVRAGRGRNGVITRAALRLVPAPETVQWHRLRYTDTDQLVADQRLLVNAGTFGYVEGQLKFRDGQRLAELEAVAFNATQGNLNGLAFQDIDTQSTTYWDFLNRLASGEPLLREAGLWDSPHPWCNVLVPSSAAEGLLQHLQQELGADLYSAFGLVLAYPLVSSKITTPRLRLPPGDLVFLIAALRYAHSDAPHVVTAMQQANDVLVTKAVNAGGTLYLDPL